MFQQRLTTARVITNADVLLHIPLKTETVAEKSQATDNGVPCINYPENKQHHFSVTTADVRCKDNKGTCSLQAIFAHVPLLAWHVHPIFSFDCSLNGKISKYLSG